MAFIDDPSSVPIRQSPEYSIGYQAGLTAGRAEREQEVETLRAERDGAMDTIATRDMQINGLQHAVADAVATLDAGDQLAEARAALTEAHTEIEMAKRMLAEDRTEIERLTAERDDADTLRKEAEANYLAALHAAQEGT